MIGYSYVVSHTLLFIPLYLYTHIHTLYPSFPLFPPLAVHTFPMRSRNGFFSGGRMGKKLRSFGHQGSTLKRYLAIVVCLFCFFSLSFTLFSVLTLLVTSSCWNDRHSLQDAIYEHVQ